MLFGRNGVLRSELERVSKSKNNLLLVLWNWCTWIFLDLQESYFYRITWVTFLKEKLESLDNFKAFKAMVENEMDMKIKCLRFDRGGVFTSNEFNIFYENHGIKRHLSTPRTP